MNVYGLSLVFRVPYTPPMVWVPMGRGIAYNHAICIA